MRMPRWAATPRSQKRALWRPPTPPPTPPSSAFPPLLHNTTRTPLARPAAAPDLGGWRVQSTR